MEDRSKIIARIKDFDAVNSIVDGCGGTLFNVMPYTKVIVVALVSEDADEVLANYQAHEQVDIAGFLNHATPRDTFHKTYAGGFTKLSYQYSLSRCNVHHAHNLVTGVGGKVCVADTGCTNHPNIDITVGYAPYMAGKEFECYEAKYYHDPGYQEITAPYSDHGMHCAGYACAKQYTDIGYTSPAPNADLYFISCNTSDGYSEGFHPYCDCYAANTAPMAMYEGMLYLMAEYGVRIFSCSWGTYYHLSWPPDYDTWQQIEVDALKAVLDAGGLIIAAAGNEGRDSSDNNGGFLLNSPVDCDMRVISVSASMQTDDIRTYTPSTANLLGIVNYGDRVDVVAPTGTGALRGSWINSVDLKNTDPATYTGYYDPDEGWNDYDQYNGNVGTSYAAPQVAGVAALIDSIDPTFTADQIREILLRSVTKPVGTNFYTYFTNPAGCGIIDAAKAVKDALVNASTYDGTTVYPNLSLYGPGVSYSYTSGVQTNLDGTVYADVRGYAGKTISNVELLIGEDIAYSGLPAILQMTASDSGTPLTVTIRATTTDGTTEESYTDIIVSSMSNVTVLEYIEQTEPEPEPEPESIFTAKSGSPIVFYGKGMVALPMNFKQ